MSKESDIESKYQRLAAEYSKVRSQATVLKKAVLEEQAKNAELNNLFKHSEQTVRKREQEMESLTFRNEQLTKKVTVLQQEIQTSGNKKNKNKANNIVPSTDTSVLNEEFQKKILENAQLFNEIAEKNSEVFEYREKVTSLEEIVINLQHELSLKEKSYLEEREKSKKELRDLQKLVSDLSTKTDKGKKSFDEADADVKFWKTEADRWKTECELIKSKPDSRDELTNYYESQLSKILETKVMLQSETKTTWAENLALKARLENITQEHSQLKNILESSYEELVTTNNSYKGQLDAMTEHLAAQNEKITKQCDEIQFLKHKLSLKK